MKAETVDRETIKIKHVFMRKFIITAVCIALCNGLMLSAQDKSHYPDFSWDKVPVAFHFAKRTGLMTPEEANFVVSHASFICLEKGHGGSEFKSTEEGIEKEAQQLKRLNPNMKVIFYWNTFLDYPMFEAHEEYSQHPEWWLKTKDGDLDLKNGNIKRYDLSNPEVRNWWSDVAKKALDEGSSDGVFMDAFPQIAASGNKQLWGEDKYQAIQQGLKDVIRETRQKVGANKLIVYNGIRSTPDQKIGYDFPEHTDAVMIEHFGNFNSGSKECMMADIQAMSDAGKQGKIVVLKAWPGFTFIDQEAKKLPLDEKRKMAQKNITFPLACFLAGAQKHSYFIYNWGYVIDNGCLEWYPELDRPLGEPLGDVTINGWELNREFEYLSVWVNLETKEAKLNWKK